MSFLLVAAGLLLLLEIAVSLVRARQFSRGFLGPGESLFIAGQPTLVADAAARFQPRVAWLAGLRYPPTNLLWFARLDGDRLLLAYRVVRGNERHPNLALHYLYGAWRALYFGSVRDIEYIDVLVSRQSGAVEAVRYEEGRPSGVSVEHQPIELRRLSATEYAVHRRGAASATTSVQTQSNGRDLVFSVDTWNGLFSLRDARSAGGLTVADLPLERATYWLVFRYRLWRRSLGWGVDLDSM